MFKRETIFRILSMTGPRFEASVSVNRHKWSNPAALVKSKVDFNDLLLKLHFRTDEMVLQGIKKSLVKGVI